MTVGIQHAACQEHPSDRCHDHLIQEYGCDASVDNGTIVQHVLRLRVYAGCKASDDPATCARMCAIIIHKRKRRPSAATAVQQPETAGSARQTTEEQNRSKAMHAWAHLARCAAPGLSLMDLKCDRTTHHLPSSLSGRDRRLICHGKVARRRWEGPPKGLAAQAAGKQSCSLPYLVCALYFAL